MESGAAYSSTGARDTRPPLSSEQEDALVSGKLEAAARHYNQLLAWQLEQNRLLYEARLRRIRDSMPAADSARSTASNASGAKPTIISSSSGGGGRGGKGVSEGANWRENMIASLRTERVKVGKQLEGAKERLERARKEAAMLQELRSGLESNRQEWQRRADSAAGMLRDVQTTFQ